MRDSGNRGLPRTTTRTRPPEPTQKDDIIDTFISKSKYKKISFSKCFCPTCSVLDAEEIKAIYNLDYIIQDNSKQIFDPLVEKVIGR